MSSRCCWQVFGQVFSEDQDPVHLTCDEVQDHLEVYHFSETNRSKYLVCAIPTFRSGVTSIGVRANPGSDELCFDASCWKENGVLRVEACDADSYGWFWLRAHKLDT